VVRVLVKEGPELVHQLIDWGVRFTLREEAGEEGGPLPQDLALYDLGREGGHSKRRIIHAHDLTGREVERALLVCLRAHPNVSFLEHHIAVDLLKDDGDEGPRCVGVLGLDSHGDELKTFVAPVVVLSTGGLGRIYQHTTNPPIATGDGVAIAWRAGLPVANLEFVQFHPTAFYSESGKTFLISEAVRGEKAQLKRLNGETFMEEYDERGCLAPRDIVARAIDTEMKVHGEPHVLLDCSNMTPEFFAKRFPAISKLCRDHGVTPPGEPIPVVPSAHYSCGGVVTDCEGRTSLRGLFVTGECACTGIHGANRLASNSLLEALVFSHRAAQTVMQTPSPKEPLEVPPLPSWVAEWKGGADFEEVRVQHCRDELQRLMWDYVGIVRKTDRLQLSAERIEILKNEVDRYLDEGYGTPAILELRNMVQTAELVVRCALSRKESRGLHYTLDYPEPVESEAVDTVLTQV
jgi:L-aspartate oxidase